MVKWVFRTADGVFVCGGRFEPQPPLLGGAPDPAFGLASFADDRDIDPSHHRFDVATGEVRDATSQELNAAADAQIIDSAQTSSRQKDILATVAFAIRQANPAAWNALTLAQKKAAAITGADTWRDLRVFIDKNL